MSILSGAYFDVTLIGIPGALIGEFMHVEGLGMEVDYQVYNEGGSNYPRFFFNGTKPSQLILSHGTITNSSMGSLIMIATSSGVDTPLAGTITMRNSFGGIERIWTVVGAHMVKYVGPTLDSNQPNLFVEQIVLVHNGCY